MPRTSSVQLHNITQGHFTRDPVRCVAARCGTVRCAAPHDNASDVNNPSLTGAVLAPTVSMSQRGEPGVSEGGPVTGKILSVICTNMQFLT